jgi:hypothetical protein
VRDLGEGASKNACGSLPQLPNRTVMVVIGRVPNRNNKQTFSMEL